MSVDAVVDRVAADRNFYRNSGGGVTFSGGEPFAQPEFLAAMLTRCHQQGIHTAVETCGHVDAAVLLAAEPLVDLFLFDVKLVDPIRHRLHTGVPNHLIHAALTALASTCPSKVILRIPLVPGITDTHANLDGIATLARELRLTAINLVPYHPLGLGKYEEIGLPAPPDVAPVLLASIEDALAVFAGHGVAAELA